jgi:hypothetical protein
MLSLTTDVPDALKNATLNALFDEVEVESSKRKAEGKICRGMPTSKIIEFKKWRAPWLTENHVYYY